MGLVGLALFVAGSVEDRGGAEGSVSVCRRECVSPRAGPLYALVGLSDVSLCLGSRKRNIRFCCRVPCLTAVMQTNVVTRDGIDYTIFHTGRIASCADAIRR